MPGGLFCAIGNLLNDGTWTYTWQNGRQLESVSMNGNTVSFVYNENGLRVQKKLNPDTSAEVVTNYTLHGKNIVHMIQGSNELHFFYDAQNKPAVVVYNGTPYTYVKNLQGDIVAILDSNGIAVVQYKYDAWGRQISCDVAAGNSNAAALSTLNPFRYRGYVYDEETGLYYLRSRYYYPAWGRFVNADIIYSQSLYVYCKNNPCNNMDCTGLESVPCFNNRTIDTMYYSTLVHSNLGRMSLQYTTISKFLFDKIVPNRPSIQQQATNLDISFSPEQSGVGGQINNSYRLSLFHMGEYANHLRQEYGEVYRGTTAGFVFEWYAHNLGYTFCAAGEMLINATASITGIDEVPAITKFKGRFEHVNFGATIYNDIEDHGLLSMAMVIPYMGICPLSAMLDLVVFATSEAERGK